MSGGFRAALAKDFRLLARDRVGIVFLTLAPIVVMTVAGLSLANLYGPAPGRATFVLPVVDEDGREVGQTLRTRLAADGRVGLEVLPTRDAAVARVRGKSAGAALVVPAGTSEALATGRPASLLLFTDPVKAVEVAAARTVVQEVRHALESHADERARSELARARAAADDARRQLSAAVDRLRAELGTVEDRLRAARAEAERRGTEARRDAERTLRAELAAARADAVRRLSIRLQPLRDFLAELTASQRAFAEWLSAVREQAGRFADRVPPPPAPPRVPPELAALAGGDAQTVAAELMPPDGNRISLPPPPVVPSVPSLPALAVPDVPVPPEATLPGPLAIEEASVTGAARQLNTFDQNVPGFSVTFLLLGVLLGVSLGLLDERDWGTLERLRATPTPLGAVLGAKLVARFAVGMGQMSLLFAVGRLAFGVSLGPQPWALLLPIVGIVAAGTAFGLVVAAVTDSREAVLPVGSIAILTMAAMGGCWWPIDLEPAWMRRVALAFPTTWAMDAFNDLMIRRQGVAAVIPATAVLLGHAAVYLGVGLALFTRRVAAGS
jgi:ABC-type multidrug transport system permease subunit